MTQGLPEIPDWIEEKIEVRNDRDVQDHHIVEVFVEAARPFLSVSYVASEIGMSPEGARNRLMELADMGVLDNCAGAGGQVYWIHDDRSAWPIPPDVEGEGESGFGDMVSELTSRLHVQLAIFAVALGLIQGLLITSSMAVLLMNVNIPTEVGSMVFLTILAIAIFSVILGFFSLATWIGSKYRDSESR